MKNKIKIYAFCIILCSLFFGNDINAQEFSKNNLKIGLGYGASGENPHNGFGLCYSLGFQKEIWRDRLRFNPNFSIGTYNSKMILDARDVYFTSINLSANLFFDAIKIKSFSLVLGCGIIGNHISGLLGTVEIVYCGNDIPPPSPKSDFYNKYHIAGYLGGGFRINPPGKRIAINIMPLNIHVGNNDFVEIHGKIELDIKL